MFSSIFSGQLSISRRCEIAFLSALVVTSFSNLAVSAQTVSPVQQASDLDLNIRQTNITLATDKQLQQQYLQQVNSLKAELAALKKTPSNKAEISRVETQLNQAQQVETNLTTNVINLSKWIVYWQQQEQNTRLNDSRSSLDSVADIFDLNGDRESPHESQANSMFRQEQAEHDARLPHLRHYNSWSN